MTQRDAALGLLLSSCLYEDLVVVLHLSGLTTRSHSVGECYVFETNTPNEFEGRSDFEHKHVGNLKVQGDDIMLYDRNHSNPLILELANQQLYHQILGYFGKQDWEIENFLEHCKHFTKFTDQAKQNADNTHKVP